MFIALDTNVLIYGYGLNDSQRHMQAIDLLLKLRPESTIVPVQVLGELYNVLRRKAGWPAQRVQVEILEYRERFLIRESTQESFFNALDIAAQHGLQVWDALILAVASHAGCRLLLSEDLQHGFTWGGVTVINPFLPEPDPLLVTAMGR